MSDSDLPARPSDSPTGGARASNSRRAVQGGTSTTSKRSPAGFFYTPENRRRSPRTCWPLATHADSGERHHEEASPFPVGGARSRRSAHATGGRLTANRRESPLLQVWDEAPSSCPVSHPEGIIWLWAKRTDAPQPRSR